MENLNNDIDNLIGKYLAGEASPEERVIVDSWRAINNNNQKYFNDLKEIFGRSASIRTTQVFDADAAWEKMRARLNKGKTIAMTPQRSAFTYLKIAASVLLLVAASFLLYRYFNSPVIQTIEIASAQSPKADTLPDGTGVFLNKASKIAYQYNPGKRQHIVKLKGEAYFEINHKKEKNFIVDVEEVFIRDIGTVFNVTAYPDSSFVEVVVQEGEVSFYTSSDNGINVKANEKGRYDKITKTFSLVRPEGNETSYRTKVFTFADMPLADIVRSLNEVYESRIEINDSIQDCRVSVHFSNEDINEIAEILAETLSLRITQSGKVIRLEGPGCGQ